MAKKKKAPEELRIEYLPLSDLLSRKDPKNAKLHDLPELEASFRKFGFVAPAALDETTNLLLFGHGRVDELAELKADGAKPPDRIREEGAEWLVPVIRGIRLGKKLGSLYRFADNAIGEGLWDRSLLAAAIVTAVGKDLEELEGTGIDTAFASQIIAHYINREEVEDEDRGSRLARSSSAARRRRDERRRRRATLRRRASDRSSYRSSLRDNAGRDT